MTIQPSIVVAQGKWDSVFYYAFVKIQLYMYKIKRPKLEWDYKELKDLLKPQINVLPGLMEYNTE